MPGTSVTLSGRMPRDAGSQEVTADVDCELVRAVRGGKREVFDDLVRRHQDRVFSRIYFMVHDRELAADLAQETFMRAFTGLAGFREDALFSTWLGRIAVNVTLHHIEKSRALKRRGKVVSIHAAAGRDGDDAPAFDIADHRNDPGARLLDNERHAAVLAAVASLDEEFRVALALRELQGMSYHEIADALGIPIGTVKSKIFRARQVLQEKLKDLL